MPGEPDLSKRSQRFKRWLRCTGRSYRLESHIGVNRYLLKVKSPANQISPRAF